MFRVTFLVESGIREYKVLTLYGPDKARSWAARIQEREYPDELVCDVDVERIENYSDEERMKSICDRMEW